MTLTDVEAELMGSWVGMTMTLLLDGADERDVSAVLAQQIRLDIRDLAHPYRDAPHFAEWEAAVKKESSREAEKPKLASQRSLPASHQPDDGQAEQGDR